MQPKSERLVKLWYDRAQLDYNDLYMRLYVAYNAWFNRVTGAPNDREAIRQLKKRFVIWDDYQRGRVMVALKPIVEDIVKLTNRTRTLSVRLEDADDWQNLIEFWYQVRCHLFHASGVFGDTQQAIWTRLAYQSLNIFMTEVVDRMNRTFTNGDYIRLKEIDVLLQHEPKPSRRLRAMQQNLYQKYIQSPDLWNVDMMRV